MPQPQRLLFVYNADGGHLAGLQDLFHKILRPATYPCSLCAITYGATAMRPAWREFVRALPMPVEFLHRDEFVRAYPQWRNYPLPTALTVAANGELQPFITALEMNATDLNGLMELIKTLLLLSWHNAVRLSWPRTALAHSAYGLIVNPSPLLERIVLDR